MLRKFKALVYLLAAIALFLGGYKVYRLLSQWDTPNPPPSAVSLGVSEQEKFLVTPHHVTTIKRDAKGVTQVHTEYTPSRAVITVNKDGSVSVKNKKFGLTFEPGIGFGYGDGFRLAPNVKVLYLDRLGLNTGASFLLSKRSDPRLFIALSYAAVGNTAVFVGVDHHKDLIGGISVQF